MGIKINIKKNIPDKLIKNYVFFTDKDFKIDGLKDLNLEKDSQLINSSINSHSLGKKNFLHFNLRPNLKITLIKIINPKDTIDNEKIYKIVIFSNIQVYDRLRNDEKCLKFGLR